MNDAGGFNPGSSPAADWYLNSSKAKDKYATFENREGFENYIAIEVASSAVKGGGFMRALVPKTDTFVQDDSMTQPDSNAPCDQPRLALWHHGSIGNIHGWVPTRRPESFPRSQNDPQC
jgi:hypothetical protein